MANAFDDVRLPDDVEAGAQGGPGFRTTIIIMGNGTEQRNQDWVKARGRWNVAYGIQTKADYVGTLGFFYARRGRLTGFRFKDWSDFEGTNELIGLGDGVNVDFQLIKVYSLLAGPYTRLITRPITGTVSVTKNDVVVLPADYTVDYDTGIITFDTPPATDVEVHATFEFDVPVRFDTDEFSLTLEATLAGAIGQLPILEIRDEAAP